MKQMTLAKERIVEVIRQVVPGDDAQRIIFYLRGKKNISEFIIAEELDLEIHRTRNLLYQLLDVNLVSFKRKKDKIKGWYICYWDFNETMVPYLEETIRLETIRKLKTRLENEDGGYFYMCRHAHARMNFEGAFEENFKCPECGELMNQVDNNRTIDFLKSRIEELESIQADFVAQREAMLAKRREAAEAELRRVEVEARKKEEDKQKRLDLALERKQKAEEKKQLTLKKKEELAKKKEELVKKKASSAVKKTVTKTSSTSVASTPKKKSSSVSSKKVAVVKKKTTTKTNTIKKTSAKKATTKTLKKKTVATKKVAKKSSSVSSKKVAVVKKKTTTKKSGLVKTIAKKIGGRK